MKVFFKKYICFLLVTLSLCEEPYTISLFKNIGCKYCKSVQSKFQRLILEKGIKGLVNFESFNCQIEPQLCRDDLFMPLAVFTKNNKKLGQVGGIHNYKFYEDWVRDMLKMANSRMVSKNTKRDGFLYQEVQNGQEVLKAYEQRRKILNSKGDDENGQRNDENIIERIENSFLQQTGTIQNSDDSEQRTIDSIKSVQNLLIFYIGFVFISMALGWIVYRYRRSKNKPKLRYQPIDLIESEVIVV